MDGLVYVADTGEEQAQGFMNVTSFGDCNGLAIGSLNCEGMIFNFSSPHYLCFWMHDTLISLQQDWIAQNGTVVSVYRANPLNDSSVCYYAKYVLETAPSAPIAIGDLVFLDSNQT